MGYVQGCTVTRGGTSTDQCCDMLWPSWQVQVRELSESFKPMIARIASLTTGSTSAECGDLERHGLWPWEEKSEQNMEHQGKHGSNKKCGRVFEYVLVQLFIFRTIYLLIYLSPHPLEAQKNYLFCIYIYVNNTHIDYIYVWIYIYMYILSFYVFSRSHLNPAASPLPRLFFLCHHSPSGCCSGHAWLRALVGVMGRRTSLCSRYVPACCVFLSSQLF